MCFSGQYTEKEVYSKIVGKGGITAYLGTNDMRQVLGMISAGDEKAKEVFDAFILHICKDIGAVACVLSGKVDQIILTGGIAYSDVVVKEIREKTEWIAPITVYAGEDEMLALVQGGLRVLNGEEQVCEY